MSSYYQREGIEILHGDCCEIMPSLAGIDHLITDPPYSAQTHRGHDASKEIADRRVIDYGPWSTNDVMKFTEASRLSISGWRVVMSDHVLQPVWEAFFRAAGLYAFAPIPFVTPGGRARFMGDGPAAWTIWINAARPIEARFVGWGALPGAYVLPPGERERGMEIGGKPLWIMRQLLDDYTRKDDLVLDACCGAGTTLIAALEMGRRAIGIERSERSCAIAATRIDAWIASHC